MSFNYPYTIRLGDTDAAGVVYFATTLHLCHTAYEAALIAVGLPLKKFLDQGDVALPITHCTAQFRRPLYCSDALLIQVNPQTLGSDEFAIAYTLFSSDQTVIYAQAQTQHTCIDPQRRQRIPLPEDVVQGLEQIRQLED